MKLKLLLVVVYLFLFDLAYASNPLRVYGIGRTFEEAKTNAFKVAVQHVSGVVLLSDRESKNIELTKNEISTYSSGYVDNFNIVSQVFKNNLYELVIDVYVNESKISHRLFSNKESTQQFEGQKHSTQINSLLQEKKAGDQLITQVLSDYPKLAYNIKQLPYFLKFDNNRNLYLVVQYSLEWNKNFLKALEELFEIFDEGKYNIVDKFPANIYFVNETNFNETKKHYKFSDLVRIQGIRNHFINQNEVRLMLTITNFNKQVIAKKCYVPDFVIGKHKPMYSLGQPNAITIWQNTIENNHVALPLNTAYAEKISTTINELQLKIVNDKDCKN